MPDKPILTKEDWKGMYEAQEQDLATLRTQRDEAVSIMEREQQSNNRAHEKLLEAHGEIRRLREIIGKVREILQRAQSASMDQLLEEAARTVRPVIMAETGRCPRCERPSDFCRCSAIGPQDEARAIRERISAALSLLDTVKPEAPKTAEEPQ